MKYIFLQTVFLLHFLSQQLKFKWAHDLINKNLKKYVQFTINHELIN